MKKALLMLTLISLSEVAIGQTTVTFKPGPAVGQDAMLFKLDNACVPNDGSLPSTPEVINFGSSPDLSYFDWTFNAYGCPGGTGRALIRFSGLSSIPSGATITSATLKLYGVTSAEFMNDGNSSYPGSPFTTTNEGYVRRVSSGSSYAWNESTVTWSSPTLSFAGSPVSIPVSTARWGWNTSVNVTSLVQGIVNDLATNPSSGNNGFLLMLQNEAHYRSVNFASSDHADSTLWPELVVTYTYCDPNFTYCISSDEPYDVSFSANATGMSGYDWYVDGNYEGSGASFNYIFPGAGSYEVCLYTHGKPGECQKCIKLCLDENKEGLAAERGVEEDPTSKIATHKWPALKGDKVLALQNSQDINVSPNPGTEDWTVAFKMEDAGSAEFTLRDMQGRQIKREHLILEKGKNSYLIDSSNLPSGMYIIEITAAGKTFKSKAVKK